MTTAAAPDALRERQIKWYGWQADKPDIRDLALAPEAIPEAKFSANVLEFNAAAIPVYDQLALGSCTANMALRMYRLALVRAGFADFDASRLAHYYWTRLLEGTKGWDAGATIRSAIRVLRNVGVAAEAKWPYRITKFAETPARGTRVSARPRKDDVRYLRVPNDHATFKSILSRGGTIGFGATIYSSTERALDSDGMVPFPYLGDQDEGGHAMVVEDYDDRTGAASPYGFAEPIYLCSYSWGADVGLARRSGMPSAWAGYAAFPQRFIHDPRIADDFWTIVLLPEHVL